MFLISYALGMFFMGYIADRTNIRIFLGLCMIGSGIGCAACGLLKAADSKSALPHARFLLLLCSSLDVHAPVPRLLIVFFAWLQR